MKINKYFHSLVLAKTFRRDSIFRRAVAALAVFSFTANALANPTGMTVQRGHATLTVNGSQLSITAGNGAVLNWQNFNIGAGETTTFNQPSAGAIVWNRIGSQSATEIYGNLHANGVVVLLNSSGFYFGPNSFVSAAGLVVSTANCMPPQNSGGSWVFNGPPPLASIINYGQIKIGNGGDCFLIADKVENHGSIETDGGNIGLAAGQTVTLSERPDGRGMSMNVTLPQGSVDNYGNLIADGGTIALNAKVVNQNGLIQANSVKNNNGVIELVADDTVNLGASSQILAQGDNSTGGSAGGNVTVKAGNNFSDVAGSSIVTTGGAYGGNGGNVEISAPNIQSLNSAMDARAQAGFIGGEFLLDPANIILGTSGNGTVPKNGVVAYNSGSGTLSLNVDKAFANKNFSQIVLQASSATAGSGNITVNAGTIWDLSASTGNSSGQKLTLQASGNIILNDGALITDANNWSVSLAAGYNFSKNSVVSGTGSILLNGSAAIQMAGGDINLTAGKDVIVNSGFVNTTAGGNIYVHALAGNIDTGSYAQGYIFTGGQGYFIDSSYGIGGISTLAGGDVNLTAGGNVTSVLPANNGYYYDGNLIQSGVTDGTAGSGAYGSESGNVNIVAGGNVTGHYLVANGTGSIFAGVKMDANGNPIKDNSGNYVLGSTGSAGTDSSNPNLALSLIAGGWNVSAAKDIILQEVRNPSGIFNNGGFDYGLNDYVNLMAGNQVQLGSTDFEPPRNTDAQNNLVVPDIIYPSILNITAGTGGVLLAGDNVFNQLTLYPSSAGSLAINTTGGGALTSSLPNAGGSPQIFDLIVSDSGKLQYATHGDFGLDDHADKPLHADNTTPIDLNISGDMNQIFLAAPEAAQINVVGNMNNCRFQGMNLNSSDVTSITVGQAAKLNMENKGILNPTTDSNLTVGGNIKNQSIFTSVDLSALLSQPGETDPDLSLLGRAVNNTVGGHQISALTLLNSFYFKSTTENNITTKILTYQDVSGANINDVLKLLQNLTVQKISANGNLLWADPPNNTIPLTSKVSVLDAATAQALLAAYSPAPDGSYGYSLGGGGKFTITANNMDLGTTAGIKSLGVGLYQKGSTYPLAKLFNNGADISINLSGNLDMYSSAIASLNGGAISIYAGGNINVGSSEFTINSASARGIYTSGLDDITVVAKDDINVNGSRIAGYNGGNVTVESLNGNINAGSGGNGYVRVYDFIVSPSTHNVRADVVTIPGSGILTTTFPDNLGQTVGNILVEAPNGKVNANAGGMVQLPLNNTKSPDAIVEVLAGLELRDLNGNVLSAANMSQPTIQGSTTAAGAGDLPRTVIIQNGNTPIKFQVSQTVWSELASALNISPAANQDMKINLLGGDTTALKNILTGNSSGLTDYNFASFISPSRKIDASGSGVIGNNVKLAATGDILGVIFARNNISLTSQENVNVVALAQGKVSADASGALTGTLIGIGGISASGDSITAALDSNSAISGDTSSSKGMAQGTVANATSAAMSNDDTAKNSTTTETMDGDLNNKKKGIALAQKVSRVTVVLPGAKKLSEKTGVNNPL